MSLTAAEKKVRKLAKLRGNCECANCGTVKTLGFSTVCIKFHTFVCNNCKSSHQAISHRCKSLTMSSWTDGEVAELESKGNDHARRTWLKHAPPPGSNGRPREGDHVDVFKRFVVDVYERRKYYGPDDGHVQHPATGVATGMPIPQPNMQARQMPSSRAPVAVPPAPAPAPVADLLDFSAAPQPSTTSAHSFEANFDAFGSTPAFAATGQASSGFGFIAAPPVPGPSASVANPASSQSSFGFIEPTHSSASAPGTSGSAFGFIKPPPVAPSTATKSEAISDFADFSGSSTQQPTATIHAEKKPIMSNSGNQQASMISSMNIPAGGQMTNNNMNFGMQQGYGGMQPNMMMGMPNNMMGLPQQQQMMMQQQMMAHQRMMQQQNMMGMQGMNNGNMMMMNGMGGMSMMNQQQQSMSFGGQTMGGGKNSHNTNNSQALNSLSMNMSSMSAWTTGGSKK